MFRNMLVPTDGSSLSDEAVERAVSFAKEAQAHLTFFHAAPDESSSILGEADLMRNLDPDLLANMVAQHLHQVLDKAEATARKMGVSCEVSSAVSNEPYEAIIAEAEKRGCDLILMASHGYRGMKGVLLGSQTQKVLTHSSIPVLVYR